jgi:hypothetical protein
MVSAHWHRANQSGIAEDHLMFSTTPLRHNFPIRVFAFTFKELAKHSDGFTYKSTPSRVVV